MLRIRQLGIACLNGTAEILVRPSSVVPECRDRLGKIFAFRQRVWLAIVPRVNCCKNVLVSLAEIRQLPQEETSLGCC